MSRRQRILISACALGAFAVAAFQWLYPVFVEGSASDELPLRGGALIVALSPECGYCDASAPFYRALLEGRVPANGTPKLVAAFQALTPGARNFLSQSELNFDEVMEMDLPRMGVVGTPTVLAADAEGRIIKTFTGVLDLEQMRTLASVLGVSLNAQQMQQLAPSAFPKSATAVHAPVMTPEALLQEGPSTLVLDIRARHIFEAGHIAGAKNIPSDELSVRAPIELAGVKKVVLYCDFNFACEAWNSEQGNLTACTNAYAKLAPYFSGEIYWMSSTLEEIQEYGHLIDWHPPKKFRYAHFTGH
jgi:hypothetical protein